MTALFAKKPKPFTARPSRSGKRSARTPPSTFLFLQIHFSNNPEPRGSVSADAEKPARPTRRREHGHKEHGRMLGHRVNSEGLRGRAIALGGGAPKRCYIVFGLRYCQPSEAKRSAAVRGESGNFCRFLATIVVAAQTRLARPPTAPNPRVHAPARRTAATFLRRSLHNRVRDVAMRGKRQLHLSFQPWSAASRDGPGPSRHSIGIGKLRSGT